MSIGNDFKIYCNAVGKMQFERLIDFKFRMGGKKICSSN